MDSTNENVGINSNGNTDYSLYVNGKIASNNYIIAGLGNGGAAVYADPELGFIRDQMYSASKDWGSFTQG